MARPTLGIGITLRPELVAELLRAGPGDLPSPAGDAQPGIAVSDATDEMLDAVIRLLRLIDRPRDRTVLAPLVIREILWRVMSGPQGGILRQLGLPNSSLTHIARASDGSATTTASRSGWRTWRSCPAPACASRPARRRSCCPDWLHRRTFWLYGRTMSEDGEVGTAQDALMRFVRNFGLHQPDRTPCGQPLPVSEAYAMAEIVRDGRLRQVELARRLKLEKSTVSRLVGNLVSRGWVRRHAAEGDGRGVLLELTDAGRTAAARQAEARHERLRALLARVPDDQRDAVVAALQTLAEAADAP